MRHLGLVQIRPLLACGAGGDGHALAIAGGLGRAGPVRLAQQQVERRDVGLDGGRDDVWTAGLPRVFARAPLAPDVRGCDPDADGADRVGPLPQCVDVVGEQARVAGQDAGQRLIHGAVQRVDRAVAFGRRPPLVVARADDDRAAAANVAAGGRGPSGELQGIGGQVGHRVTSGDWRSPRGRSGPAAPSARGGREVALVPAPELGARLPDGVLERVGERRRGRRDDVGVAAHRRPRPGAVHRIDDDPGARRGRRAAVEDAHLVVDEVDVVEPRVERPERLAQGGVERVDRAVAVGCGMERLAVDLDLDRRLGQQLATVALLDEAGVVDDPERRGVVGAHGAG